jgi:hypothetical protein
LNPAVDVRAGHIVALGNSLTGHCLELHEDDRFSSHSLRVDEGLERTNVYGASIERAYCFETSAIRETSIPGA